MLGVPVWSQCIAAKGGKGRQVLLHPQEALLQEARALQQSADYDQHRRRRVVAEHRLARLVQLGIRQGRYFGRVKTKCQLYLEGTVANLTLLASQIGVIRRTLTNDDYGGVGGQASSASDHRDWTATCCQPGFWLGSDRQQ